MKAQATSLQPKLAELMRMAERTTRPEFPAIKRERKKQDRKNRNVKNVTQERKNSWQKVLTNDTGIQSEFGFNSIVFQKTTVPHLKGENVKIFTVCYHCYKHSYIQIKKYVPICFFLIRNIG